MDFEKLPQYSYHLKNNTPTGRIIKALDKAFDETNAMMKELKDLNTKRLKEMVDQIRGEIKKANDTANEAIQRLEELTKQF